MPLLGLGLVGLGLWHQFWSGSQSQPIDQPAPIKQGYDRQPIAPLPIVSLDPAKVALGRQLFNDPSLSHDNTVSCNSCHDLTKGGSDRLPRSIGIHGQLSDFNAPTVFNSSLNFKQFWNGRVLSLEEQIDGPVTGEKEMASTWPEVIAKLQQSPEYIKAFRQLYPEGLKATTVKAAIATFERSLITPARFDRFLRGETGVLNALEQTGYDRFKSYGCIACHQGVNVGGNMFQRMGVMEDYFSVRGNVRPADEGRFILTHNARDRYVFKVPSLRNVEITAPYFHDGHIKTLEEAVDVMAKYQLGRSMPQKDRDLIVQFLKTLTGKLGGQP
jgi:cytochrome c peroxidase